MPSLREIRSKIKSVKSTQQITKAMKMVAAARLRRAQARILSARPFAQKMEEMMTDLRRRVQGEAAHPLFMRREGTRRALLLVTSDKGLCGAFNTNLIRRAVSYLNQHSLENVQLYVVGRKGRDYFQRMNAPIAKEYVNIFNALNFAHAEVITQDLMEAYLSPSPPPSPLGRGSDTRQSLARRVASKGEGLIAVDMLYNEFKSVIQQRVAVKSLLPLVAPSPIWGEGNQQWPDYLYEPVKEQLLEALIPRFLKAQVYRVLLESCAAELGARVTAMDNATHNAADLTKFLTNRLNRTRQASITKEILEVVSGAEALT